MNSRRSHLDRLKGGPDVPRGWPATVRLLEDEFALAKGAFAPAFSRLAGLD